MSLINDSNSIGGESYPVDEGYLKLSEKCSVPAPKRPESLIILDLNGTLCSRTTTKSFYTRPHADTFFNYIFRNFTVMVWSSAQESSVKKMCSMFEPHKPDIVWHRGHLGLSTADFYRDVEAVKDLENVWNAYPQFSAINTFVLDDTEAKLAAQPYNLVLMRTFDHNSLAPEGERDLLKVVQYLSLARVHKNVCNYIRYLPFDYTLDWCTVPNLIADKHLNHFVNGVNVNPVSEEAMQAWQVLPNPLDGSLEEMEKEAKIMAKKTRKRLSKARKRLALRTQLQFSESTTLVNKNTEPTEPIDPAQSVGDNQARNVIQSLRDALPDDNIQSADVQSKDSLNIVDMLLMASNTVNNWNSNTNEEPTHNTTDLITETIIPDLNEGAMNKPSEISSTPASIQEIMIPGIEANYDNDSDADSMNRTEIVIPNPFEVAYMKAFATTDSSPTPIIINNPKPKKIKQPKASRRAATVTARPYSDPIALLQTRPVKSILKSVNNPLRIESESSTSLQTLLRSDEGMSVRKSKRMLRQENNGIFYNMNEKKTEF